MWSNSADKLLLLKLLKKLILVLIERCQNTQCIAVCCVGGCSHFLLHHMYGWVCVRQLPGEHMAPGCTMGRRQAGGGSVMLWAMFCWETLGRTINVDVTLTRTTYPSIVADHVHPFMETVLSDGFGLFQQDYALCHKEKWFRNGLRSTTMSLR